MLVLTRCLKQSIVLKGSGLTVLELLSVRGKSVRLGFHAPDDIKIYRSELLIRKNFSEFQNDFNLKGDDQSTHEQLIDMQSYRSSGDLYR